MLSLEINILWVRSGLRKKLLVTTSSECKSSSESTEKMNVNQTIQSGSLIVVGQFWRTVTLVSN